MDSFIESFSFRLSFNFDFFNMLTLRLLVELITLFGGFEYFANPNEDLECPFLSRESLSSELLVASTFSGEVLLSFLFRECLLFFSFSLFSRSDYSIAICYFSFPSSYVSKFY